MQDLLSLKTLGEHRSGAYGMQVDELIRQAIADCDARPNLSDKRTITLTIELVPEASDIGMGMGALGLATVETPNSPLAQSRVVEEAQRLWNTRVRP